MKGFELLSSQNSFVKDDNIFLASFRETAQFHYNNNAFIKFLWDKNAINPKNINSIQDLERAPYTLVNIFKDFEQITGPYSEIVLTLGSSGTSGQRSLIHLNQESLDNVKKMAYKIHKDLKIVDDQKYNYLCFTYDPKIANDVGTAFTDELLTSFTQKNEVYYALEFDNKKNDFTFDVNKVIQKLKDYAQEDIPVRILGFPAFLYKTICEMKESIALPENSWVQTGGGWKTEQNLMLDKFKFRDLVYKKLNILPQNNRDMFGMVEHGVPYLDCEEGKMRIPNFSRVLIRDPKTFKVVKDGEKGILQLICTYNTSYPAFNLLTTDWAVKNKDDSGEYIEILGRGGVNKNKGCALKALEVMRA